MWLHINLKKSLRLLCFVSVDFSVFLHIFKKKWVLNTQASVLPTGFSSGVVLRSLHALAEASRAICKTSLKMCFVLRLTQTTSVWFSHPLRIWCSHWAVFYGLSYPNESFLLHIFPGMIISPVRWCSACQISFLRTECCQNLPPITTRLKLDVIPEEKSAFKNKHSSVSPILDVGCFLLGNSGVSYPKARRL